MTANEYEVVGFFVCLLVLSDESIMELDSGDGCTSL